MNRIATTAAVLALAGTALAQYEITIDVENPVLRPGESTTVTLHASFDPSLWAMAGVAGDLLSSVGSTGFSDAMIPDPMTIPRGVVTPGEATDRGFEGFVANQINFFNVMYADPTNPIPFWTATYTAPADTAAPFDVELMTATTRYDVFWSRGSAGSESHLADLVEGSATIRVIPAPASALVLALGAVAVRRRR